MSPHKATPRRIKPAALTTLVLSIALGTTLTLGQAPIMAHARSFSGARVGAGVNGPIVALSTTLGKDGITVYDRLLTIDGGRATFLTGMPTGIRFIEGDLAPSPRGRYIDAPAGFDGLWQVNSDGTGWKRVLHTVEAGVPQNVTAVDWSPDKVTLAYGVSPGSTAGVYLVRYDGTHPRLLVTNAQLTAQSPASIPLDGVNRLSWSSDGRTLAVSLSFSSPDFGEQVVLLVDTASGRILRVLRGGIADAVFAPSSPSLAYVYTRTTARQAQQSQFTTMTLVVGDALGRHTRALFTTPHPISSLTWAPDSGSIAYLWNPGTPGNAREGEEQIHAADVATGTVRVVLLLRGMPPALRVKSLTNIAWMHTRT